MAGKTTEGERLDSTVIVIGGGVSGCACAASLASMGAKVTVLNPALDRLGEPAFGPVVMGAGRDHAEGRGWLETLPGPLKGAWEKATLASEDGSVVTVDRRLVGMQTKHALEQMEGVQLRQALVTEVNCVGRPGGGDGRGSIEVRVETAFGESLLAEAAVVAVGLGLGESTDGSWLPRAEELMASLAAMGAEFVATQAEVGPTLGGEVEESAQESEQRGIGSIVLGRVSEAHGVWGEGAPASPYDQEELWPAKASVVEGASSETEVMISPDGLATGELAVTAWSRGGGAGGPGSRGRTTWLGETSAVVARPGYVMHGLAIANVGEAGRLKGSGSSKQTGGMTPAVWVTGRAAGSTSYIESLAAGVQTAKAVARTVECGAPVCGEQLGS